MPEIEKTEIESYIRDLASENFYLKLEAAKNLFGCASSREHISCPVMLNAIKEISQETINSLIALIKESSTRQEGINGVLGALWILARHEDNQEKILQEEGLLERLLELFNVTFIDKKNIFSLFVNLSNCENGRNKLRDVGVIVFLVNLLNEADEEIVIYALRVLLNLALNDVNEDAIRECEGLPKLAELLEHTNAKIRENAVGALKNLVWNDTNRGDLEQLGVIEKLRLLFAQDLPSKMKANMAALLDRLAFRHEANQIAIREVGGIAFLVKLLDETEEEIVINAAEALWSLVCNKENKDTIRHCGGLPKLAELVGHTNAEIRENAVGALTNLVWNNKNRDFLVQLGIIEKLRLLFEKDLSSKMKANMAALLKGLAYRHEANQVAIREVGGITFLVRLLDEADEEIVINALRPLSNLALNDVNEDAIRHCGGLPKLVELVGHTNVKIRRQALGVLKNLVNNQDVISVSEGLPKLLELLGHTNVEIRRQALGVLKKLVGYDANQENILTVDDMDFLIKCYTEENNVSFNKKQFLDFVSVLDWGSNSNRTRGIFTIRMVLKLLDDTNIEFQKCALTALWNLSNDENYQAEIRKANGKILLGQWVQRYTRNSSENIKTALALLWEFAFVQERRSILTEVPRIEDLWKFSSASIESNKKALEVISVCSLTLKKEELAIRTKLSREKLEELFSKISPDKHEVLVHEILAILTQRHLVSHPSDLEPTCNVVVDYFHKEIKLFELFKEIREELTLNQIQEDNIKKRVFKSDNPILKEQLPMAIKFYFELKIKSSLTRELRVCIIKNIFDHERPKDFIALLENIQLTSFELVNKIAAKSQSEGWEKFIEEFTKEKSILLLKPISLNQLLITTTQVEKMQSLKCSRKQAVDSADVAGSSVKRRKLSNDHRPIEASEAADILMEMSQGKGAGNIHSLSSSASAFFRSSAISSSSRASTTPKIHIAEQVSIIQENSLQPR